MIGVGQSIILTTGDFRHRHLAQDPNSEFGKILSIDKLSKKSTLTFPFSKTKTSVV